MKLESALRVVVLPDPVPPETMMLSRRRDGRLEIGRHVLREGAEADEVADPELLLLELPDGDEASVDGDRRNHRIEAAAILQTSVDIGVALVDAAVRRR